MPAVNQNKSILLLSDVFPPQTGGSGRWLWEIYRRLPREQVVIAAGEYAGQDEFDRTHDLRLTRVALGGPTWGIGSAAGIRDYLRRVLCVRKLVRDHGITTIHCGTLLPEGWVAWLLKMVSHISYVCYVHGEELNIGARSRELRWMMGRVLQSADFIIANSTNTKNLLQRDWKVDATRIEVLHPGVDVEQFVPKPRSEAVRRQLGWDDRTVVLTVGRLQKRKGQDQLIRALPQIRRTIPDVLYAIVGDGEERRTLEQLAQDHDVVDNVHFHGELRDERLIECYQQCDLFVLPNREVNGDIEGFGMVLVEAQACGTPVIAGASGGTSETMRAARFPCDNQPRTSDGHTAREDGEPTGIIVDCNSPDPLAQTIVQMLEDPVRRQQMGHAGRSWAVQHFSWTSLARRARELFGITADDRAERTLSFSTHRPHDGGQKVGELPHSNVFQSSRSQA